MTDKVNCITKTNLENLMVTQKASEEIQHPSKKLTLRERQLLIMLVSNSHYCEDNSEGNTLYCKMCNNLMKKVDLASLVARHYLTLKPGKVLIENDNTINELNCKATNENSVDANNNVNASNNINVSDNTTARDNNINAKDNSAVTNPENPDEKEPDVFLRVVSGNF